ncbi:hypothetical protein OIDMADRAFT_57791 [Oidiodendron maius Zn]|uniref:Uncharacterized protein n=1 Tax=Oidiodendron maius (strain Zn) TaxID=913774 RepID=A0A0C3H1D5_OIDMZ|nr:hypothetical protein OIDMADRAFT_57791 [Oidiodendron maius Zn]
MTFPRSRYDLFTSLERLASKFFIASRGFGHCVLPETSLSPLYQACASVKGRKTLPRAMAGVKTEPLDICGQEIRIQDSSKRSQQPNNLVPARVIFKSSQADVPADTPAAAPPEHTERKATAGTLPLTKKYLVEHERQQVLFWTNATAVSERRREYAHTLKVAAESLSIDVSQATFKKMILTVEGMTPLERLVGGHDSA